MKPATLGIALAAALVVTACGQSAADPPFVSVGRGAPVEPKLRYPMSDVASLGDELANYAVVGPFRVAVRGKPGEILEVGSAFRSMPRCRNVVAAMSCGVMRPCWMP